MSTSPYQTQLLTEKGVEILGDVKRRRAIYGYPTAMQIKKHVERTDTRHVYPVGWEFK